jgi:hypothetical protein
MADEKLSAIVAEKAIVVPAYIDYPETRITIDSGVLKKDAQVKVTVQVIDKGGADLLPATLYVTKFPEYPADPKEVLGVIRVSFNESVKAPIVEIPTEPQQG